MQPICCVGIELVSETTEAELAFTEGVKPDLVKGIEFAYTLPAADLVVIFLPHSVLVCCL